MNVLSMVSKIFDPFAKLVDSVHTSTEEKKKMEAKILEIKNEVTLEVLTLEKQMLESQTKIISAEATGESWMQRNWRPITMLTFLALVVCDSFGWLVNPLSEDAWLLLQIGLGGYVGSRGVEKSVKGWKEPKK